MAKIPFDIKFRPQIESGEYRVETFSGYPVTIYRWDFYDGARTPIMGSYVFENSKEYVGTWNEEGHFDLMSPNDLDLYIITPEPELSNEFEIAINRRLNLINGENLTATELLEETKGMAAELFKLAKDEIYSHESLVEYAKKAKAEGKAEALKDLPRWKEYATAGVKNGELSLTLYSGVYEVSDLFIDRGLYIPISELEKLPGFKED